MSEYILWNPASRLPSRVRFGDRPNAIKAAHSMSASNPGERFYVCKLVGFAERPKNPNPSFTDLEREEELPL